MYSVPMDISRTYYGAALGIGSQTKTGQDSAVIRRDHIQEPISPIVSRRLLAYTSETESWQYCLLRHGRLLAFRSFIMA
jgi:hypothetical protein